jgi:hypothetical protein
VDDLHWTKEGADWILRCGRRKAGCVVPDESHAGMWRVQWPDGQLSDMANISRAKDALARFVEAEGRRRRRAAETVRRSPMRLNPQGVSA